MKKLIICIIALSLSAFADYYLTIPVYMLATAEQYAPDWMSPEEAELLGLKRKRHEPRPIAHPPTPQPSMPPHELTIEEQLSELKKKVERFESYDSGNTVAAKAATAAAWGAGLPGGGSFYVGRYGHGIMHVVLQVGTPILMGFWAANSNESSILFLSTIISTGVTIGSKIGDMSSSYYYQKAKD